MKIYGKDIYLDTLEREDCRKIWSDLEYDFANPGEEFIVGLSVEKADAWFDEIQSLQGKTHVRLGIFLRPGEPIGDVALQDLDFKNRVCSVGIGISKLEYRSRGYGRQAIQLILDYGFHYMGLERITACTLSVNTACQKALEASGFVHEGTDRKAFRLNGEKCDLLRYGILVEDYEAIWHSFDCNIR